MASKSNIPQKVEDALNSLNGVQRATPGPYFYTRLQARLASNERNIWEKFGTFISRPAVAFATICLIVVFNTMAFFKKEAPKYAVGEQVEQALNSPYDVATNTANSTILTIWNPEDEQSFEK